MALKNASCTRGAKGRLRGKYQQILDQIPKEHLVCLDESGLNLNTKKEYGWKKKRERLHNNKSDSRRGKRITVISAYSKLGLVQNL